MSATDDTTKKSTNTDITAVDVLKQIKNSLVAGNPAAWSSEAIQEMAADIDKALTNEEELVKRRAAEVEAMRASFREPHAPAEGFTPAASPAMHLHARLYWLALNTTGEVNRNVDAGMQEFSKMMDYIILLESAAEAAQHCAGRRKIVLRAVDDRGVAVGNEVARLYEVPGKLNVAVMKSDQIDAGMLETIRAGLQAAGGECVVIGMGTTDHFELLEEVEAPALTKDELEILVKTAWLEHGGRPEMILKLEKLLAAAV